MNTTTISKVLKDTKRVLKHQKEIAILKGETFNVFSILKMESKENATHSAFLGELLDPKGSHNLGSLFLALFLKTLGLEDFDIKTARLTLEKDIGPRDDVSRTGGRIDIFIQDANNTTICIENKIYAIDQFAQIERYCNYNCKKNNVYYLTLEGDDPTEDSVGNKVSGEDFIPISYNQNIIEWLNLCTKEASAFPILRETIKQYSILIKKLTNQLSDSKMEKEIKELIKSNYLEATTISSTITKVELDNTTLFLEELKQKIENDLNASQNLWNIELSEDLTKAWSGLYISHKNWPENIYVQLQGNSKIPWNDTYYGIVAHKKTGVREKLVEELKTNDHFDEGFKNSEHWPFYKTILWFGNTEERAKLLDTAERSKLVDQVSIKMIELAKLCELPLIDFTKLKTN